MSQEKKILIDENIPYDSSDVENREEEKSGIPPNVKIVERGMFFEDDDIDILPSKEGLQYGFLIDPMEFFKELDPPKEDVSPDGEVKQDNKVVPLGFLRQNITENLQQGSGSVCEVPLESVNDSCVNTISDEKYFANKNFSRKIEFSDEMDYSKSAYKTMQKLIGQISIIVMGENIHVYNGIYYELKSLKDLSRLVLDRCRREVEAAGTPKYVDNVVDFIMKEPRLCVREENLPKHLLTFENGVLDIGVGVMQHHSDKFLTLHAIKGNYTKIAAYAPEFESFLYTITQGDTVLIKRIWEMIGYIISPDTGAKVFFLLQGVPNSGKSVLATVLTNLFSENAVMTLDAHAFNEKYSISELVGKALCISPDLPSTPLDAKVTSKIKQITGNDIVSSNRKYMDYVKFHCTAKLILVTNHALLTKTSDAAFYDRVITIPFKHSVPRSEMNPNLVEAIMNERDAIVTKAINAYYELRMRNYKFSGDYLPNQVVMNSNLNDNECVLIHTFIRSNFEPASDSVVFTSEAYERYCSYYGDISTNEFSHYFIRYAEEIFGARKERKRKAGAVNATSCMTGIKWKENTIKF